MCLPSSKPFLRELVQLYCPGQFAPLACVEQVRMQPSSHIRSAADRAQKFLSRTFSNAVGTERICQIKCVPASISNTNRVFGKAVILTAKHFIGFTIWDIYHSVYYDYQQSAKNCSRVCSVKRGTLKRTKTKTKPHGNTSR